MGKLLAAYVSHLKDKDEHFQVGEIERGEVTYSDLEDQIDAWLNSLNNAELVKLILRDIP